MWKALKNLKNTWFWYLLAAPVFLVLGGTSSFVSMSLPAGLAGRAGAGDGSVSLSSGLGTSPCPSTGEDGFGGVAAAFSTLCLKSQASESSVSNTNSLAGF